MYEIIVVSHGTKHPGSEKVERFREQLQQRPFVKDPYERKIQIAIDEGLRKREESEADEIDVPFFHVLTEPYANNPHARLVCSAESQVLRGLVEQHPALIYIKTDWNVAKRTTHDGEHITYATILFTGRIFLER
jgi:hypothetical protein